MRITIIPLALFLSAVIFLASCNSALAYENDIGQSKIHPASPLYFLKSVREILELKFAGTGAVRAFRQLEFATRRLREVKSLVNDDHPELIQATLERYWAHISSLPDLNLKNDEFVIRINETISLHLGVLESVYSGLEDPQAKMAIRTTINKLLQRMNVPAPARFSGCNFLSKEASSSALNETEKVVLLERARKCLEIKK